MNSELTNEHQPEIVAERWELLAHIGEGGMSDVYKARHVLMNKIGAVKFLKGNLSTDPVAVKRFQQEALACGSLTHPNIVQTYDCGLSEKGFYLILEYLEGTCLADILDDLCALAEDGRGKLTIEQALPIFVQICDSLDHAHRKGIVHRDIKPSNVMLVATEGSETGHTVKLVDFGIAKLIGRDGTSASADGNLTLTGEVFGSPLYMSPEQCMGKPVDGRSDIYSIGCLMYETVVGRRAILGNSATETMMKHVHDSPDLTAMADLEGPAVEGMHEIIAHCLEKDPDMRYQTMAELKADLEALPVEGSEPEEAPAKGASSLVIFSLAVLGGVVTTVMGLAIYYLLNVGDYSAVTEAAAVPLTPPISATQKIIELAKGKGGEMQMQNDMRRYDSLAQVSTRNSNIDPVRQSSWWLKTADRVLAGGYSKEADSYYKHTLSEIEGIPKEKKSEKAALTLQAETGRAKAQYFSSPEHTTSEETEYKLTEALANNDNEETKVPENIIEQANEWKARMQLAKSNYNGALSSIQEMLFHWENTDLDKVRWTGVEADIKRLFGPTPESKSEAIPLFVKALESMEKLESDQNLLGEINYRLGLAYTAGREKDYRAAAQAFRQAAACFNKAQSAPGADSELLQKKAKASKRQVFDATKEFDSFSALVYKVQNGI